MSLSLRKRLRERFRDPEHRHDYVESFLNSSLATQIKVLRQGRNLSQRDLAALIGTKQSAVSKLEDPAYEGWTLKTLQKLARAFDVSLDVQFVAFGQMLDRIAGYSARSLQRVPFDADPAFARLSAEVSVRVEGVRAAPFNVTGSDIRVSNVESKTSAASSYEEAVAG